MATPATIKAQLTLAMQAAFPARYDDGTIKPVPAPSPAMIKFIDALSTADAGWMHDWILIQTVNPLPTMTASGIPVLGVGTLFP